MFKADAAKLDDEGDEKWYIFDEPELNNDNESVHVETPDEIWAVKKKVEVKSVHHGKDTVERKKTAVNKKEATETRQYFRTYIAEFGNEIDENDNEKLQFEGYVVIENRAQQQERKNQRKFNKKNKNDDEEDNENKPTMATLDGKPYNAGINLAQEKEEKKEENIVFYAADMNLKTLTIIYNGKKGEQHAVIQFDKNYNEEKQTNEPCKLAKRLASKKLEFSSDAHLRECNHNFIIQTESNDKCTAKNLTFDNSYAPTMELKNATRGLMKDVWVYRTDDEGEIYNFNSFCMSSVDDSLHVSAMKIDAEAEEKNLTQLFGKIKSQKFTLDFPCLVYNVSLNEIKIQSTIAPEVCTTLNLIGRDFLSFV